MKVITVNSLLHSLELNPKNTCRTTADSVDADAYTLIPSANAAQELYPLAVDLQQAHFDFFRFMAGDNHTPGQDFGDIVHRFEQCQARGVESPGGVTGQNDVVHRFDQCQVRGAGTLTGQNNEQSRQNDQQGRFDHLDAETAPFYSEVVKAPEVQNLATQRSPLPTPSASLTELPSATSQPTVFAAVVKEIYDRIRLTPNEGGVSFTLKSDLLADSEIHIERYYGQLTISIISSPATKQWLQVHQTDLMSRLQQRFSHDKVKLKIESRSVGQTDEEFSESPIASVPHAAQARR